MLIVLVIVQSLLHSGSARAMKERCLNMACFRLQQWAVFFSQSSFDFSPFDAPFRFLKDDGNNVGRLTLDPLVASTYRYIVRLGRL